MAASWHALRTCVTSLARLMACRRGRPHHLRPAERRAEGQPVRLAEEGEGNNSAPSCCSRAGHSRIESDTVDAVVNVAVRTNPVDAVRARALGLLGPLAPSLLRDRDARTLVYGVASIALALALTFAVPMVLLAIGPIVLGVPHLVADVRYLVAKPQLHRRWPVWLFVFVPAMSAFVYPHASVSMLAVVGAALVARRETSIEKRALAMFVGLALVVACFELGWVADVVIAHAHNVIAVVLFVLWTRSRTKTRRSLLDGRTRVAWAARWAIPTAFAVGLGVIALGWFDHGAARLRGSSLLDGEELIATLAPADVIASSTIASRLVLAFAFAQSVHYAVWVRLVPEQDRERPGMRSFASSYRALAKDLGRPLVVVAALVMVGFAVWAMFALANARDGYLRLAVFHGPLELGAAVLLILERGHLGRGREHDDPRSGRPAAS